MVMISHLFLFMDGSLKAFFSDCLGVEGSLCSSRSFVQHLAVTGFKGTGSQREGK